jgi:hypothetical protein
MPNMQLTDIDKARYSRHFKLTFAAIAIALAVLSITISTIMIRLFSTEHEPHFWFNLGGVVIAAIIVFQVLKKLRHHPFLYEVAYVWDLKQQLNRIARKQRKLEELAEGNDADAMRILLFQYRGSKQLYELDDNTITIDELIPRLKRLEKRMQEAGLDISTVSIETSRLDRY